MGEDDERGGRRRARHTVLILFLKRKRTKSSNSSISHVESKAEHEIVSAWPTVGPDLLLLTVICSEASVIPTKPDRHPAFTCPLLWRSRIDLYGSCELRVSAPKGPS